MQKIRKSHFEHFNLKTHKTHKTHKTPVFITIKTLLFNQPGKL